MFTQQQPRPLVVDIAVRWFELHGAVDKFLAFLQAAGEQQQSRGGEQGVGLGGARGFFDADRFPVEGQGFVRVPQTLARQSQVQRRF